MTVLRMRNISFSSLFHCQTPSKPWVTVHHLIRLRENKVLIVFEDVVGVFTSLTTHSFTTQGHGVLEMPSGTGKTISLLSLIVAYQKVSLMCIIIM